MLELDSSPSMEVCHGIYKTVICKAMIYKAVHSDLKTSMTKHDNA